MTFILYVAQTGLMLVPLNLILLHEESVQIWSWMKDLLFFVRVFS